jgi:hypothetical protein
MAAVVAVLLLGLPTWANVGIPLLLSFSYLRRRELDRRSKREGSAPCSSTSASAACSSSRTAISSTFVEAAATPPSQRQSVTPFSNLRSLGHVRGRAVPWSDDGRRGCKGRELLRVEVPLERRDRSDALLGRLAGSLSPRSVLMRANAVFESETAASPKRNRASASSVAPSEEELRTQGSRHQKAEPPPPR